MSPRNIVIGQNVTEDKILRARELRREMTKAETILWQELRLNRLGGWHFRRQQIICGYIVDFYCHQAALILELDGPVHEYQVAADLERANVLVENGLRILRFTNQQVVEQLPDVLRTIGSALQAAGKAS